MAMTNATSGPKAANFALTWPQKLLYLLAPLALSAAMLLYSPLLTGAVGTPVFILMGVALGLVTFFISAGWSFRMEITEKEIQLLDRHKRHDVPLEKVGMLIRNGGFPFPTLWIILRNASVGKPIPESGVDPRARELIEAYRKRNPGKTLTYVPVPGGFVRSVSGLAAELKGRIPPLAVDERIVAK